MKVYVGNLPWSVTDLDLQELFAPFGTVESAQVVTDRDSGRSRGFGFVEMAAQHAPQAIAKLNGHQIESRSLRVNEAQAKQKRSSSFYFFVLKGRWNNRGLLWQPVARHKE